jgi:hypothetical protein
MSVQVEETGQKNTVLTLYELTQGENTKKKGPSFGDLLLLRY